MRLPTVLITLLLTTASAFAQEPPQPWTPVPGAPPPTFLLPGPTAAPAAFHVNALSVPLAAGTPLTAHYAWDFGDAGSKYDQLPGWVAAHLYEKPGTYQITVTVIDEAGHTTTLKEPVTVTEEARRAIYVAPEGSDDNNGATAAVPLKSAAAGFMRTGGGHAVLLFKAGGTYPANALLGIKGSDTVVTRYGDGPDPVLLLSHGPPDVRGKPTFAYVGLDGRIDGCVIEHLTFATPYTIPSPPTIANKVGLGAIFPRGKNITILDCAFHDLDDAINCNANPACVLVQGCSAPGPVDLRGYFIWSQGADHAYLGNRIGNSTREHNIRTLGLTQALMYDNDLTNLDRRPIDPSDGFDKGCIEMQAGSFVYIAHNRTADGPLRTGPRGGPTEKASTATDWTVVDGNDLTDDWLEVQAGTHHVMFRNNVIHFSAGSACRLAGPDQFGRTVTDLTFAHNTAIAAGTSANFLRTFGKQDGLTIVDNLFVAPQLRAGDNGASALYFQGDKLDGLRAIANNVWPKPQSYDGDAKGMCVIDPTGRSAVGRYVPEADWDHTPPVVNDRFERVTVDALGHPTAGNVAVGAPTPGTQFDHDGHPRPATGPRTVGAFEQAGPDRGSMPAR
jgi:PKD repeat protein